MKLDHVLLDQIIQQLVFGVIGWLASTAARTLSKRLLRGPAALRAAPRGGGSLWARVGVADTDDARDDPSEVTERPPPPVVVMKESRDWP